MDKLFVRKTTKNDKKWQKKHQFWKLCDIMPSPKLENKNKKQQFQDTNCEKIVVWWRRELSGYLKKKVFEFVWVGCKFFLTTVGFWVFVQTDQNFFIREILNKHFKKLSKMEEIHSKKGPFRKMGNVNTGKTFCVRFWKQRFSN